MKKNKIKVTPKVKFELVYIPEMFFSTNLELIDEKNNIFSYTEDAGRTMHHIGGALAMATKLDFGSVIHNVVLHDSGFNKLPNYVQEYMMQHEIGHIVNGDLEKVPNAKSAQLILIGRSFGILPAMEVAADKYAASMVGIKQTRAAMMFLVRRTDLPLISKIEFLRRYIKVAK